LDGPIDSVSEIAHNLARTTGTSLAIKASIQSSISIATGFAIGLGTAGASVALSVAIAISCKIAHKILEENKEVLPSRLDRPDILRILEYRTASEFYNGPAEIISAWYKKFVPVWKNMGENSLKIKGFDTGISLSRIGFVLTGSICTLNDIVNNIITLPFFGFSYLAKKIFSRNNTIEPERLGIYSRDESGEQQYLRRWAT